MYSMYDQYKDNNIQHNLFIHLLNLCNISKICNQGEHAGFTTY